MQSRTSLGDMAVTLLLATYDNLQWCRESWWQALGGEESLETPALFRWMSSEPSDPDMSGHALIIVPSAMRGLLCNAAGCMVFE